MGTPAPRADPPIIAANTACQGNLHSIVSSGEITLIIASSPPETLRNVYAALAARIENGACTGRVIADAAIHALYDALEIARPRPVPPLGLPSRTAAARIFRRMRSRSASGTPGPGSNDFDARPPLVQHRAHDHTSPAGLCLAAFDMRFSAPAEALAIGERRKRGPHRPRGGRSRVLYCRHTPNERDRLLEERLELDPRDVEVERARRDFLQVAGCPLTSAARRSLFWQANRGNAPLRAVRSGRLFLKQRKRSERHGEACAQLVANRADELVLQVLAHLALGDVRIGPFMRTARPAASRFATFAWLAIHFHFPSCARTRCSTR